MHDQNFKNLILDYPRQALAFFAAEEIDKNLAEARIIPIRQEQLKERLGERFRELDVPLLVEWPDGDKEAILFVLEEETQHRRFSIYRLAHYCLDLAELLQTDRVVPVVIFLGKGRRRAELKLGGDRYCYLQFHYLACELKQLEARQFRDSDNIVARLNLPNMQYPAKEKLAVYAAAQTGLAQLENNPELQLKYLDFIDYYADLTDQELDEYQQHYLNEEGDLMGFAQFFKQQGIQQGVQQGLQQGLQQGVRQGMQQGEALILRKLLEKRFGTIPKSIQNKIDQADAEMLLRWSERLLSCKTLEEIFH